MTVILYIVRTGMAVASKMG